VFMLIDKFTLTNPNWPLVWVTFLGEFV
jgi:hypothetical protein